MRTLSPSIAFTGLLVLTCSGGCDRPIPTSPGQAIGPPISAPPPPVAFAAPYIRVAIGEVVNRRVTADAPTCVGFPEFRCQHFRLTVPDNGFIDVVVTTIRSSWRLGLDVSVSGPTGGEYWGAVGGQATVAVQADATYQITVWYAAPDDEFELRSSLRPEAAR